MLFEPPQGGGHEHQPNAVAVLEALGPLPPAIRPAALSIPRSTATTATGEQKYPLLLRNSARRSYTKRTSLERISRGRTFGRRTSTGLNSAEPIETNAPSGLARDRQRDQIPCLGTGWGAGGVFAPTRLRIGVVAEEANKFVSLSLNSFHPLAPATQPPPHLLPPTLKTFPCHSATHGRNRDGTSRADRRSDESFGPKRLCKTEDCAERILRSSVPAHMAHRDCAREEAKCRGFGPMV